MDRGFGSVEEAWAKSHVIRSLRGVSHETFNCTHIEEEVAAIQKSGMVHAEKLCLIHVTRDNEVMVSHNGPVDDFTMYYMWSLAKTVASAINQTRLCSAVTFAVVGLGFFEQLPLRENRKNNFPVFSSCMTTESSTTNGVFIPRP